MVAPRLVLCLCALAVVFMPARCADRLALRVRQFGAGSIRISWNGADPSLAGLRNGTLEIRDGGETATIRLSPERVGLGTVIYRRRTGDVSVRLRLSDDTGQSLAGIVRYVTASPAISLGDASRSRPKAASGEASRSAGPEAHRTTYMMR